MDKDIKNDLSNLYDHSVVLPSILQHTHSYNGVNLSSYSV